LQLALQLAVGDIRNMTVSWQGRSGAAASGPSQNFPLARHWTRRGAGKFMIRVHDWKNVPGFPKTSRLNNKLEYDDNPS